MSGTPVTLAIDPSLLASAERWTEPLLKSWPRPEAPPTIDVIPLDALRDRLAANVTPVAKRKIPTGVVVTVLAEGAGVVHACQTIDLLQRALAPGVMLMADADSSGRRLESGGVLVERHDADPAHLARVIHALGARQATVRLLADDVHITQSHQGGMRGEMERLHEELHLAASVQRGMLPRTIPTADTLAFGALYRPAGYVSGDLYDIRRIDDRRIAFLLADAVGHGVPAALLTMIIARALRIQDDDGRVLEPSRTLELLNDELCHWSGDGQRFATAAYGIIDTHTHRVTLSTAGHPPPFVIDRDTMIGVETGGPLLGVFEDAPYEQETFTLAEGSSLLLYSDGFELGFPDTSADEYTQRTPSTRYLDAFRAIGGLHAMSESPVRVAIDHLTHALDDQPGSLHQPDDVTAVLLTATAAPIERTSDASLAA
ncbi:MAG: PP2C family protein-serine/threonine phosphatase [Planctomycetota bacterium]